MGHSGKPPVKWKQAWATIGGQRCFFRSKWEHDYALYLELLKEHGKINDWQHEPKTFWFDQIKRGTRSYLPDFRISESDGTHTWVEIKGYMDAKSKTKLKRFKKYFPEEKLYLVQEEQIKEIRSKFSFLYKKL